MAAPEQASAFPRPLPAHPLVLAADARAGAAVYADDVVWALEAAAGPDGGLRLRTSAGVRVHGLHLFPWVEHAGQRWQDPTAWAQPPALHAWGGDYARLAFQPIARLEGTLWVWVAHSRVLWLRLRWRWRGAQPWRGRWAWAALLQPLAPTDAPFEPWQRGGQHVLRARVGERHLVLFLTGDPAAVLSPYPGLQINLTLEPDQARGFTAVLVWAPDPEQALTEARRWAARPWEAIVARLRLSDERAPRVGFPGNPHATWWAEQGRQLALRLLHGPTDTLPHPFPVRAREPDHGFSPAGTGADHPFAWSGLAVAEAWYAAVAYSLWAEPHQVTRWVENFVHTQTEPGLIDGSPGLGGQRGRFLASPLLVDLAWRAFRRTQDRGFAARVFPALRALLQRWCDPHRDVDQDGWPEWQHPLQLGLDAFPLSAGWEPASPGVDLRVLETPAALAYLYRGLAALEDLARAARQPVDPAWAERRAALQALLPAVWDPQRGYPHHRDRDTHHSPPGRSVARGRGPGRRPLDLAFDPPVRLVVQVTSADQRPRAARVTVRGRDDKGRLAALTLDAAQWRWFAGRGVATAPVPLKHVAEVVVEGLAPADRWRVLVPDLHVGDITLLAPLWAGMLTPDDAARMVQSAIVTPRRFGQAWGLPIVPGQRQDTPPAWRAVTLLWNVQVVEGLWLYGFRDAAAALLYRLAKAHWRAMAQAQGLPEAWDARTGAPQGGRDTISALPPLGPVLQVAGLEVAPRWLRVRGPSWWPEPLTVRGWGWRLTRTREGLTVHGPGDAQVRLPADARGVLRWQRGAWVWQPATRPAEEA